MRVHVLMNLLNKLEKSDTGNAMVMEIVKMLQKHMNPKITPKLF